MRKIQDRNFTHSYSRVRVNTQISNWAKNEKRKNSPLFFSFWMWKKNFFCCLWRRPTYPRSPVVGPWAVMKSTLELFIHWILSLWSLEKFKMQIICRRDWGRLTSGHLLIWCQPFTLLLELRLQSFSLAPVSLTLFTWAFCLLTQCCQASGAPSGCAAVWHIFRRNLSWEISHCCDFESDLALQTLVVVIVSSSILSLITRFAESVQLSPTGSFCTPSLAPGRDSEALSLQQR